MKHNHDYNNDKKSGINCAHWHRLRQWNREIIVRWLQTHSPWIFSLFTLLVNSTYEKVANDEITRNSSFCLCMLDFSSQTIKIHRFHCIKWSRFPSAFFKRFSDENCTLVIFTMRFRFPMQLHCAALCCVFRSLCGNWTGQKMCSAHLWDSMKSLE